MGERQRADDQAGLVVASRLSARGLPAIEVDGDLLALMDVWKGYDRVIVVDTMISGQAPGTVSRFDARRDWLGEETFVSTHGFGLAWVVRMAGELDVLPPQLIIYGIEGGTFGRGCGISAEVKEGCSEAVRLILAEVRQSADGRCA